MLVLRLPQYKERSKGLHSPVIREMPAREVRKRGHVPNKYFEQVINLSGQLRASDDFLAPLHCALEGRHFCSGSARQRDFDKRSHCEPDTAGIEQSRVCAYDTKRLQPAYAPQARGSGDSNFRGKIAQRAAIVPLESCQQIAVNAIEYRCVHRTVKQMETSACI
jgi:hypothetical protein